MKNYLDLFDNIIDILVYYDRPVLFVSEINKIKYICELIDDNRKIEEWLISDITDDTYDSLKALNIDLYSCFKHSMSGTSKILQINDKGIERITNLFSINIPDEDLPLKGIYMRIHSWGDDCPYWSELYKAQKYLCKFYEKCTGKHPITKEKWGTIRYEAEWNWIENEEHGRLFRECIMRTVRKFPTVAGEVANDAGFVLNDDYFRGWCAGVTFQANGSYWTSDKRPNGV